MDQLDAKDIRGLLYMATCGDYIIACPEYCGCDNFEEQLIDMCEDIDINNYSDMAIYRKENVFATLKTADKYLTELLEVEQ